MKYSDRTLTRILGDLDEELREVFTSVIDDPWGRISRTAWQPALDIAETATEYIITADLPGVLPGDVEVIIKPREIIVCGSRNSVETLETTKLLSVERVSGRFCRKFHLEDRVNTTSKTMYFKDGVLHLRITKESYGRSENEEPGR
jgi:HSP20 family protein